MGATAEARQQAALEAKGHFDKRTRELKPLQQGQCVWVQDPKTLRWTNSAVVQEMRESGTSYTLVPEDGGRPTISSRSHLRPKVGTEECAEAAPSEERATGSESQTDNSIVRGRPR